jgi:CRP-like cAMP-binding protein
MDSADRPAPPAEALASEDLGSSQERARLFSRYGRRFVAGETLFREGDTAREALLLQEGRIQLLKRVGMTDRRLAMVKPGDLLGEGALLPDRTYGSTAVGLTDGVVLAFDRETFGALIDSHPHVASRAIRQLALRLRDAEDQIEIMMLRGVQSKVTGALLKLAKFAARAPREEKGPVEVIISPVELSTRVGLDVDTVKRTVLRLRDRQYLRISGERIEIPDVEALRRLSVLLGAHDDLEG